MFNFLLNPTSSTVIDKATDSFSGSSANIDISSDSIGKIVIGFTLGAITMLIIFGIVKCIKINKQQNIELKEKTKKSQKSDE